MANALYGLGKCNVNWNNLPLETKAAWEGALQGLPKEDILRNINNITELLLVSSSSSTVSGSTNVTSTSSGSSSTSGDEINNNTNSPNAWQDDGILGVPRSLRGRERRGIAGGMGGMIKIEFAQTLYGLGLMQTKWEDLTERTRMVILSKLVSFGKSLWMKPLSMINDNEDEKNNNIIYVFDLQMLSTCLWGLAMMKCSVFDIPSTVWQVISTEDCWSTSNDEGKSYMNKQSYNKKIIQENQTTAVQSVIFNKGIIIEDEDDDENETDLLSDIIEDEILFEEKGFIVTKLEKKDEYQYEELKKIISKSSSIRSTTMLLEALAMFTINLPNDIRMSSSVNGGKFDTTLLNTGGIQHVFDTTEINNNKESNNYNKSDYIITLQPSIKNIIIKKFDSIGTTMSYESILLTIQALSMLGIKWNELNSLTKSHWIQALCNHRINKNNNNNSTSLSSLVKPSNQDIDSKSETSVVLSTNNNTFKSMRPSTIIMKRKNKLSYQLFKEIDIKQSLLNMGVPNDV